VCRKLRAGSIFGKGWCSGVRWAAHGDPDNSHPPSARREHFIARGPMRKQLKLNCQSEKVCPLVIHVQICRRGALSNAAGHRPANTRFRTDRGIERRGCAFERSGKSTGGTRAFEPIAESSEGRVFSNAERNRTVSAMTCTWLPNRRCKRWGCSLGSSWVLCYSRDSVANVCSFAIEHMHVMSHSDKTRTKLEPGCGCKRHATP
jgi:hypothetical protein